MELAQLQHFCVLAETENIVDASQILCISQPALTVSIQRLESELGTPLFDRSNHKLVLNEAGKQALPYANTILSDLEDMKTDLQYTESGKELVRIASSFMSIPMFLSQALGKAFPDVIFNYQNRDEGRYAEYLKEGIFDLTFSCDRIQDPEVESKIILKDWYVVSVPQSHPLFNKRVLTLEDLEGSTFMTSIDAPELPAPSLLFNMLRQRDIPIRFVTMANSFSVINMARRNDYLFSASSLAMEVLDDRPHRRFIPIDPNEQVFLYYYVSYLKRSRRSLGPYLTWLKRQFNQYVISNP